MRKIAARVFVVLMIPLLILYVIFWIAMRLLWGTILYCLVWAFWCTRGRHVLLVYSDSPNWHDYVEENIIPRLPDSTISLNWSQRQTWRWHWLSVRVFHYFGGTREYNPIVIVFRPFRWAKTFRFWQAFKDYKHGNERTLEMLERDLFASLGK